MIYNIDEIVKRHLLPSENHIYGFADLTGLVQNKFFGYNYGISIGRKLDNRIVYKIVHGPTPEYYSHYRQINEDLGLLTERISEELNKNGCYKGRLGLDRENRSLHLQTIRTTASSCFNPVENTSEIKIKTSEY